MPDVFTVSKFTLRHDQLTNSLSLVVELPPPNGPLVFGLSEENAKALHEALARSLSADQKSD